MYAEPLFSSTINESADTPFAIPAFRSIVPSAILPDADAFTGNVTIGGPDIPILPM